MNFDFFHNPFAAILELTASLNPELDVNPNDPCFSVFLNNPLPIFSEEQIKIVKNTNDTVIAHVLALIEIGFSFPFFPQIVSRFRKLPQNKGRSKYSMCFVYNTVISWFLYFQLTGDLKDANTTLFSLISITTVEYQAYSSSLLTYIFRVIIERCSKSEITPLINTLIIFFSTPFNHPKESCFLIPSILSKIVDYSLPAPTEEIQKILSSVSGWATTCHENNCFDSEVISIIISSVEVFILRLNLFSLNFLEKIVTIADNESLKRIYAALPRAICESFAKDENRISWEKDVDVIKLDEYEAASGNISIISNDFNMSNISFNSVDFPHDISPDTMCSKNCFEPIKLIIKSLADRTEFVQGFIESLIKAINEDVDNEAIGNILAGSLVLFESLKAFGVQGNFLIEVPIFDPRVTFYSHLKGYEYISSIRNTALNTLFNEESDAIEKLLEQTKHYPLIFAEIIYRITKEEDALLLLINSSPSLLKSISCYILYYREMDINQTEHKKEIELARSSLFYLVSLLIDNSNACSIIFNNQFFNMTFPLVILEEPLREFGLSLFAKAFQNIPIEKADTLFNHYLLYLTNSKTRLDDERYVKLIRDLIQSLQSAFQKRNELTQEATFLFEQLYEFLLSLQPTESHKELFVVFIKLFIDIYKEISVHENETAIIKQATKTLFGEDPPDEIYYLFIKYMMGDKDAAVTPCFVIKVPMIFKVFFEIFINSKRFDEAVDFISSMISFSPENASFASECEIDKYLLTLIKEKAYTDTSKVGKLLKIFEQIATVESPPLVVKQFISLISPVNNMLSPIHIQLMETLWYLVSSSYYSKQYTTLLGHHKKEINFETSRRLSRGLTICFWIMIHSSNNFIDEEANIFSFSTEETSINVYMKNDKIFLKIVVGDEVFLKETGQIIKTNIWTRVVFMFENIDDKKCFVFNRKDNQNECLLEIPPIKTEGTLAKVVIGCDELQNRNYFVELGTSFLSPFLTLSLSLKLNSMTPLSQCPNGIDVLACYYQNQDKEVEETNNKKSFSFSLMKLWKLDIILPLFSMFQTPFANGEMWLDGPSEIISIFTKALLCNDYAQRNFCEFKKFSHIAHLLTLYPKKTLTYDTYLQFYSMYQTFNLPGLKSHIIDAILASPSVWLTTSADDHLRILEHWPSKLFPSAFSFINEIRPFKELLNILSIFYWYEYNKDTCFIGLGDKRERDPNLDIDRCRSEIIKCIKIVTAIEFTRNNLLDLFMSCQSVADDIKQTDSLLTLAADLVSKISPSDKANLLKKEDLTVIHELANRNIGNNTLFCLKLILKLMNKNIIADQDLLNFIEVLIMSLPPEPLTNQFYNSILKMLAEGSNALFSVCCWYAANHSDEEREELCKTLNNIKPGEEFCLSPTWLIWPIVLALMSHQSQRSIIISFIIECKKDKLINLLASLDVVCRALGEKTDDLKSIFLNDICAEILCGTFKISERCLDEFLNYIFSFLFYRRNQIVSTCFRSLYLDSCFKDECEWLKSPQTTQKQKMHGLFIARSLSHINLEKDNYVFGYRIDNETTWLDEPLAITCMHLITKTKSIKYYSCAAFICHNLLSKSPEVGREFFKGIGESSFYPPIVSSLSGKLNKNISPCPIQECEKAVSKITINTEIIKNVLESIKQTQNEITKFTDDMINSVSSRSESEDQVAALAKQKLTIKMRSAQRNWNQVWSSLSAERGPWSSVASKSVLRWMRDDTTCFAFCPARLKLNKHFDDHMQASKNRDNSLKPSKCAETTTKEQTQKQKVSKIDIEKHASYGQRYIFYAVCKLVKPINSKKGKFALTRTSIELLFDYNITIIQLSDVKYVFLRTKYHKKTAIEIFTYSGRPYFINFPNLTGTSLKVLELIKSVAPQTATIQTTFFAPYFQSLRITDKWVNGAISNFEYLMNLNVYSGRSFLDQSQYPVFPVIIIEKESPTLNFSDKNIYRDLTKPIGALDQKRLETLKEEMKERDVLIDPIPYLFCSGPVSRLTICIFLLRMEPFTSLHIKLQSNRFDVAERQLHSINEFISSIFTNSNDFREYIPEFYFLPDFLVNQNNFDLGKRSDGVVNDIILPPWAKSPYEFIYLNRKALESNYVSSMLNNWIDLMWGYKQRGEEAINADNVFISKLYEDVWEKQTNFGSEEQVKAFLNMIGQIPPQLFKTPHPKRQTSNSSFEKSCTNMIPYHVLYSHYTGESVVILSNDGKLHFYNESFEQGVYSIQEDHETAILQQYFVRMISSINESEFTFASVASSFFICIKANESTIYLVNVKKGNVVSIPSPHQSITHVSGRGFWYMTCGNENATNVYKVEHPKKIQFTTQNYRDGICCTCISDTYKVLITGTRDNALVVTSLTNGVTVRVIDLKGTPTKVHVTDSFGFIVACMENPEKRDTSMISVFTINGDHIITKCIDYRIAEWCFWTSHRGFDYIGIISGIGSVLFAEVFYLDFTHIGIGVKPPLSAFFFSETACAIGCVSKKDKMVIIPFKEPCW